VFWGRVDPVMVSLRQLMPRAAAGALTHGPRSAVRE
jgi:hypothetical protein